MAKKNFTGAPFGVQTARFDVAAVHPKSKKPGTFTQVPYDKYSTTELKRKLGPGVYEVYPIIGAFSQRQVEERADGPGWERAYETQRMAALPHLLNRDHWERKQRQKKMLGPGTYEVHALDFVNALDKKPASVRGIIQTKEQRFRERVKSEETPGPGTYGKGGIPAAAKEEKAQESASRVGLLSSGAPSSRTLPIVGTDLAPGRYERKSFTEELSDRMVSKRGPYDLFTGERNKPITVGHFAVPKTANLGPGEYELKSFLMKWSDEHNTHKGKFSKLAQHPKIPGDRIYCHTLSQCPRPEGTPGPGTHSPKEIPTASAHHLPPFKSSAERFDKRANKFFLGSTNPVGPGRYEVRRWERAQHVNANSSVFNSKTSRQQSLSRKKFMNERIRMKDVRVQDRVFIVEPQTPDTYLMNMNQPQAIAVA
ncbi:ciliary microtubule-associated protein 2-like [Branchiostoma floridae x Branchiostoma belcheri]|nr:hypothetical protein Bbelb_127050 [Branchiostoma belcheri]